MSKYIVIEIDQALGEASLTPTLEFSDQSALWRVDVLNDLMVDIQHLYEQARKDMSAEFTEH
jgi:hypothetical protein|tara:strand:- start:640 stop:825 length:186 start_codon:yes stop_codon:yes gene_type:complete